MPIKLYTKKELQSSPRSKGDIFKEIMPEDLTFDYALPQKWVDSMQIRMRQYQAGVELVDWLIPTTVWTYPKGSMMGCPQSCCKEVQDFLDRK